tara:strand:- start:171 stop:1049 length:879 start_codon:yes stop_codon:yes gene_type:complete
MEKKYTGLQRDTKDKYYTIKHVVKYCLQKVKKNIKITKNDLCIEPSAGNGAFIKEIKQLFNNYKFYDLEPEHKEVIQQDYFTFDINTVINENTTNTTNTTNTYNKIHVIGNPPFGRQSSLAIKFIKKSATFCDTISFILPKSFKKDSLKKHFPINFHLIYEQDLPERSFKINNMIHGVPCIFQIWEKKTTRRIIPEKLIPKKFSFVKKEEPHDISFRRVGVYAGRIDKETENKSFQSHYFIKFNFLLTDTLYEKLKNINYSKKNDTVGPKSISKQELIKEFNKIIEQCLPTN